LTLFLSLDRISRSVCRMDLNTALISGAGTVLCGVCVAIIFIFGFKEKTFEEALDEQRRRGGEFMDLISGEKGRAKKPKKAGKKKEKEVNKSDAAAPVAPSTPEMHPHVEFKFPEAEVVSERETAVVAPQVFLKTIFYNLCLPVVGVDSVELSTGVGFCLITGLFVL
jgi:hypothetical protein